MIKINVWNFSNNVISLKIDNNTFYPKASDFYNNINKEKFIFNNIENINPKDELKINFLKIGLNVEIHFCLESLGVKIDLYAIKGNNLYLIGKNNKIFVDYAIGNNNWYFLNSDINIINQIIEKNKINIEETINYSEYILLLHSFENEHIKINDSVQQQLEENKQSHQTFSIKNLKASLYSYQITGCNWLKFMYNNNCGSILGDEMGLGKTLQIIALFASIFEQNNNSKFLVVCPVSLLLNWYREIQKFYPNLKVLIHQGARRTGDYRNLLDYNVVIVSYSNVGTDLSMLNMIDWDIVAIDEAQNIKNPYANRTRNIKLLRKKVGVAITGTPFENHVSDIWSIADFVIPNYFGKLSEFENNFADNIDSAEEIEKMLTPIMIRRKVNEVAKDLPDRIDIPQPILMTDKEATLYEEKRINTLENPLMNTSIDKIQGLRMFCTHPMVYNKDLSEEDPILLSNKYARMCEILEEIIANNEKAIIFTSFNKMIEIICNDIPKRYGIKTMYINGSIIPNERQKIIDEFSEIDGSAVLVLNPKAAGAGLNITSANHVIHYNLEWNPAIEDQASARAYRRGQIKKVFIYRLFYTNTIEEVINDRIKLKRSISDTAVIGNQGSEKDKKDLIRALNLSPIGGK